MEKEILRFEQVTGRGRKFPIQNVDFAMKSGYIYGLTGRNGAGKSDMYPRTTYFLKNVQQCKMQKRWAFFMMISR